MTQEKKRYKKMIDASERMITLIVIATHTPLFSLFSSYSSFAASASISAASSSSAFSSSSSSGGPITLSYLLCAPYL
jgi:uncharacterized membrane protein